MRFTVIIKPNSRKGPLVEPREDGSFIVYVREIAAKGQANAAVIKLLAKYLGIPKTSATIVKGYTSCNKIIAVVQ